MLLAGKQKDQKDPMLLLESFRITQQFCPESHLVIAGGGSLKPKLENTASKTGLSGNVHFLGPVPSDVVAELLGKTPSTCPECVQSVQGYQAKSVLKRLYQEYRDLSAPSP